MALLHWLQKVEFEHIEQLGINAEQVSHLIVAELKKVFESQREHAVVEEH